MIRDKRFVAHLGRTLSELQSSNLGRDLGFDVTTEEIGGFHYATFLQSAIGIDLGTEETIVAFFFASGEKPSEWATGIPSGATREQVLRILGEPSRSRAAQLLPILGQQGSWDRWDRPDFSLHVQYSFKDGSVAKVTLMHPSVVPK